MYFIVDKVEFLKQLHAINVYIAHNIRSSEGQWRKNDSYWYECFVHISARVGNASLSFHSGKHTMRCVCPAQVEEEGETIALFIDLFDRIKLLDLKEDIQLIMKQENNLLIISPENVFLQAFSDPSSPTNFPNLAPLLQVTGRLGVTLPALSEQLGITRSALSQKFGSLLLELANQLEISAVKLAENLDVLPSTLAEGFEIPQSIFSERLRTILLTREQELENRDADEFLNDSVFFEERFPRLYGWHTRGLGFPDILSKVNPSQFTVDEINDLWEKSEDRRWHDELEKELHQIAEIQRRWFRSEEYRRWDDLKGYAGRYEDKDEGNSLLRRVYDEIEEEDYHKAKEIYTNKTGAFIIAKEKYEKTEKSYKEAKKKYRSSEKTDKAIESLQIIETTYQKAKEAYQKKEASYRKAEETYRKKEQWHKVTEGSQARSNNYLQSEDYQQEKEAYLQEKEAYQRAKEAYRQELSKAVGALFAKLSSLSGHTVPKLAHYFGIPQSMLEARFQGDFERLVLSEIWSAERLDALRTRLGFTAEHSSFPHILWLFETMWNRDGSR